jgi:hypothetical protein
MNINVTWEVDDGYAGKARPQHTEVDVDEEEWEEMMEQERKEYIEAQIEEEFRSKISFIIKDTEIVK